MYSRLKLFNIVVLSFVAPSDLLQTIMGNTASADESSLLLTSNKWITDDEDEESSFMYRSQLDELCNTFSPMRIQETMEEKENLQLIR